MPRPLRIEYPGARYHVMCRGNRGAVVFGSDNEVNLFLKTLSEVADRTDWMVHAYVLMSTHYHLLLETPSANLVDGMKWFQGTFTQRMNAMTQTWGHLFQGRYKAKIIDDEASDYFRKVSDYIHLNPAAAGLLTPKSRPRLESYLRSSYPLYLKSPSKRPKWLCTETVLSHHNLRDTVTGRKAYKALMHLKSMHAIRSGKKFYSEEEWKSMERGWVHGEQKFRERMLEHLNQDPKRNTKRVYDPQQKRDMTEAAILRAIRRSLRVLSICEAELPAMKKSDKAKHMIAAYIKGRYSIDNAWIAKKLHMGHPSVVGKSRAFVTGTKQLLRSYSTFEQQMKSQ